MKNIQFRNLIVEETVRNFLVQMTDFVINNLLIFMTKQFLLFTLFAFFVWCQTNKEIIQATLNGVFEQNKLADPNSIVPCIDQSTGETIVQFIGQQLTNLSKGSFIYTYNLTSTLKQFYQGEIPQQVKDCFQENSEEWKEIGIKYNVDETTPISILEKKYLQYIQLHYLQVHKWFGDLDNAWKNKKYYQVGFDGATHAHSVLSSKPLQID